MSMPDPLAVCEAAARAGGRVLQEWIGRFAVSTKGPKDYVTEADIAAQSEVRRIVLEAFPDHGFVGEESLPGERTAGEGDYRWIVDPLDGTTNYVRGIPAYCTSVALARGNELLVGAIHDPVRDECFTAQSGGGAFLNGRPIAAAGTVALHEAVMAVSFPAHVDEASPAVRDFLAVLPEALAIRRSGSTAINLAYVACGRFDGFWVRRIHSWDVAAGLLLVSEAGGATGPFEGGGAFVLDTPAFISAATPRLLAELQRVLPPWHGSGGGPDAPPG
jgi:myo-inositol-1(or 4)-monophosphatase